MPRMVRFVSEIGARSLPPDADFAEPWRWPDLDWAGLAERHGYEPAAFERHVPPASHPTFDSWRQATQHYQATLLRHQIETMRRLKYTPTGGFTLMMLNDAAPAISWSLLDHHRTPKLAHQAVVDACRPVIVIADQLPELLHPGSALALDVHVVNDLRHPLQRAQCSAVLRWPGGSHAWHWEGDVTADGVARVGIVRLRGPRRPRRAVARPDHRARRPDRHQPLRQHRRSQARLTGGGNLRSMTADGEVRPAPPRRTWPAWIAVAAVVIVVFVTVVTTRTLTSDVPVPPSGELGTVLTTAPPAPWSTQPSP